MGGSPFRLIRLSDAGSKLLDRWLAGDDVEHSAAVAGLRDRLLDAGMVHPVVVASDRRPAVSFVIPVRDDAAGLEDCLAALRSEFEDATVVVVDDASANENAIERVATAHQAQLLRHAANCGPAAARNTGWRALTQGNDEATEVVFFLDADVTPEPGSLGFVLAHFEDANVNAVAPRVGARSGEQLLDSYEVVASPLDLGAEPAIVRPGNWPSYVPSAALAVRAVTLIEAEGFDEDMRFGEDVDFVWRLCQNAHTIRYEPRAVVRHRNRGSLRALLRQRFGYGTSAGPLATRHGDVVTPLRLPATMALGWAAALFGGRLGLLGALAGSGVSVAKLAGKLEGKVESPLVTSGQLVARAQLGVAGALGNAATRNYAPLLLFSRRTRRALVASLVIAPAATWFRSQREHNVAAHVALKAIDDSAYCAGVWAGAWRERSGAALLPNVYLSRNDDD